MWHEILRDYDEHHSSNGREEIRWFQSQPSLKAAINTATRAVDANEKRYDHQFLIWRSSIPQATAALLAAEAPIARIASFDDLLRLIEAQLRNIAGVGELYYYDTAFRIGAYLGWYPTHIYLHRGTRVGARALTRDYRKDALELSELPRELHGRQPHEVENILCIYADRLAGGPMPKAPRPRRC
jgi:hypothetical protein